MKKGKDKQLLAYSNLRDKVDQKLPSEIGFGEATFFKLDEILNELITISNLLRAQQGDDPVDPRRSEPTPDHKGGRRKWLWNRK